MNALDGKAKGARTPKSVGPLAGRDRVPDDMPTGADYLWPDRCPPKLDPSVPCGAAIVWPDGALVACGHPAGHVEHPAESRYHQAAWAGGFRTWETAKEATA